MIVVCGETAYGFEGVVLVVFADDVEEELVYTPVVGELGMEGRGQQVAGADEHGVIVATGKDLDARAKTADARRADENHLYGAAGERSFGVEDDGVVLAAIGVALDVDVEDPEAALGRVGDVLREEDAAGAGAEDGLGMDKGVQRIVKAGALEMLEKSAGLTAGEDEGIQDCELLGFADEVRGSAELGEALRVDVEGALQGEYADVGSVFAHSLRVAV